MANINVDYINPFISASSSILKDLCNIDVNMGKPYLKQTVYDSETLLVIIGVTGELRGQVLIDMSVEVACDIASHMMMGMPVPSLNDMAKSAVSELANMILGNTATIFSKKGLSLDITPPSICLGSNLVISVSDTKTICVPLNYGEDKTVNINIAVKES